MFIAGQYVFRGSHETFRSVFALEAGEVREIIAAIDTAVCISKCIEPKLLAQVFATEFEIRQWRKGQLHCEHSTDYYVSGYQSLSSETAIREIDFLKNRVGVEILFDQRASVVYDISAQMTIFHKMGLIDAGIGILPVKEFADEMSTDVLCFEQIVWDLEHRGEADIDIPVLILGVAAG